MKITSSWTVHLPWRNIEFRADLTWAFVIPTWAFFQSKIRMHYIIAGIHSNPIRFIQRLVCFDHCFLVKMFFWGICQQNPMRFKVFFQSEIEKKPLSSFNACVRMCVWVCVCVRDLVVLNSFRTHFANVKSRCTFKWIWQLQNVDLQTQISFAWAN